jgi:plastocyanin
MSGSHRLRLRVLGAALAVVCLLAPVGSAFAQDADVTVAMQGVSFAPPTVHITPGQTVLWVNDSPLAHTVTSDDGLFDSDMVDPGGTFTWTADAAGEYQYFCQPHGSAGLKGMAGKIIVDTSMVENADTPQPAMVEASPAQPALVRPDEYYPDH